MNFEGQMTFCILYQKVTTPFLKYELINEFFKYKSSGRGQVATAK